LPDIFRTNVAKYDPTSVHVANRQPPGMGLVMR